MNENIDVLLIEAAWSVTDQGTVRDIAVEDPELVEGLLLPWFSAPQIA